MFISSNNGYKNYATYNLFSDVRKFPISLWFRIVNILDVYSNGDVQTSIDTYVINMDWFSRSVSK
jgi:hypothetical protein